MSRVRPAVALALAGALAAAGAFGWWERDLRWRPHPLDRSGAEVDALLEHGGWTAPVATHGPALYVVVASACPDCLRFESEEFPRLEAAGVEARVLTLAPSAPLMRRLATDVAQDGVEPGLPLLVWRDRSGRARACACRRREAYAYVRRELGAPS